MKSFNRIVFAATLLAFTVGTASCIRLEAPLLPNVSLKDILAGKDPVAAQPTTTSTPSVKRVLAPLAIAADVLTDLDITSAKNCVQLVELPNKTIVVDFSAKPCPTEMTIIPDTDILYTATYQYAYADVYRLSLGDDEIGEMELSDDGASVSLIALCSGRYVSNCYQQAADKKLSGKPLIW